MVAATFALPSSAGTGFLLVAGFPGPSGSVLFDIDQRLVLARLNACCPPIAKRAHLQDGFLAGRFPFDAERDLFNDKSSLRFRLIAKLRLADDGSFWNGGHSPFPVETLLPPIDPLAVRFMDTFGERGPCDLVKLARQLASSAV
jgi:hypothetical protein